MIFFFYDIILLLKNNGKYMNHYTNLNSTIFFYNNQTAFLDCLFKNKYTEILNKEENINYYHFNLNNNKFTFSIHSGTYNNTYILFSKGHSSNKNELNLNILLKVNFNIIFHAIDKNININKEFLLITDLFKPSFENLNKINFIDNYSSFDIKSFSCFCQLFNNKKDNINLGEELFSIYLDELKFTTRNINYQLDYYFNNSLSSFEESFENKLVTRIDNFLIFNYDSECFLIEFKNNSHFLFHIDKNKYHKSLKNLDDDIFFDENDFIYKFNEIKKILTPFYIGKISDNVINVPCFLLIPLLIHIEDSNSFIFNINPNESKKINLSDFSDEDDIYFILFYNSSFKWYNKNLYNPNKINEKQYPFIYIDKSFKNINCYSDLLLSYPSTISSEWQLIINESINLMQKNLNTQNVNDSILENKIKLLIEYKNKTLNNT